MNFIQWLRRPNKSLVAQWIEAIIIVVPIVFVVRTFVYGLYQVPSGSMETTILAGESFVADKFTYWRRSPKHGEIITFNDPQYRYSTNPAKRWFESYIWGPINLTKRVIGVPGDRIRLAMERGKPVVYRNGTLLDEPYLNKFPLVAVPRSSGRGLTYRSYDSAQPLNRQPFYRMTADERMLGAEMARLFGLPSRRKPGRPAYEYRGYERVNIDVQPEIILGPNQYWVMGDNRQGSIDSRVWGPLEGNHIHGRILMRLWSIDAPGSVIMYLLRHPIQFWHDVRWRRFFQRVH